MAVVTSAKTGSSGVAAGGGRRGRDVSSFGTGEFEAAMGCPRKGDLGGVWTYAFGAPFKPPWHSRGVDMRVPDEITQGMCKVRSGR